MTKTAETKRQGKGIGLGGYYARWLAPAGGGAAAIVETIAVLVLAMAIAWMMLPHDPLFQGLGFPWAWLLPVVLALRYGSLAGVVAVLTLLGGWFFFHSMGAQSGVFPRMFFLGGLLLVLVAGQFGDVWSTRLARANALNRYLDERLAALTKSHYLLRISHARLESDLLAHPTTLRDTLAQMRAVTLQDAADGAALGAGTQHLAGAQSTLQVVAQTCQVESAALYACDGARILPDAVASMGPDFLLDLDDPLVRHCLDTRELAHLTGFQKGLESRYVAVAPVLAGSDRLIGVLVVERMPFLSLTHENLQMLMVLMGFYADGVEHAAATHDIQTQVPTLPYAFALDYVRLSRLRRETGIASTVMALVFDLDETRDALFDQIVRNCRAMDVAWPVHGSHKRALLTLMPLTNSDAVAGYLVRIEDMLRAQFGTDFAGAQVGVHMLSVPAQEGNAALAGLLQRCQLGDCTVTSLAAGGASNHAVSPLHTQTSGL